MKYLCLISAERVMEQLTPAEAEQHWEDYRQFNLQLRDSKHFVGGNRLLPPDTAKTVRVRNGKATVTDGPWVETKGQLGGYYIFDAKDMDEALSLAARIPGSWIGCVEVRPLADRRRPDTTRSCSGMKKERAPKSGLVCTAAM